MKWLFFITNFKGWKDQGIKLERETELNSEGSYNQYEKIRMWSIWEEHHLGLKPISRIDFQKFLSGGT